MMAKSAKPQPTFSTTLKCLRDPILTNNKKYGRTTIYQKGGEIHNLIISPKQIGDMKENGFYLVTNVKTLSNTWMATEKAEFLDAPEFRIDQAKVEAYFCPPIVSIKDVLTSEEGRVLSAMGTVIEVSDVLETTSSRRREITISDGEVEIKGILWGSHADLPPPALCATATLQNCQVKNFRGVLQLHSRDEFRIKIEDKTQRITGIVEGVSFRPEHEFIIVEENRIRMTPEQIQTIFPDKKAKAICVAVEAKNGIAQNITIVNEAKKRKTE